MNEEIRVDVTLKGDLAKRFRTVKHDLGLESNPDVLRCLVSQEYQRIGQREQATEEYMHACSSTWFCSYDSYTTPADLHEVEHRTDDNL